METIGGNQVDEEVDVKSSILLLTKKKLGIAPDYHAFDEDIITDINTVLFSISQVGIGKEDFAIEDDKAVWADFLGDSKNYEAVKTYIYIKVRLMFDPPTSSFVLEALKQQATELEWRLNFKYENQNKEGGDNDGNDSNDL